MLTGMYPSGSATDLIDLKDRILYRDIDFSIIKDKNAADLLKVILEKDQNKRATIDQIFGSKWVTNNIEEIMTKEIETIDQTQGFGNL